MEASRVQSRKIWYYADEMVCPASLVRSFSDMESGVNRDDGFSLSDTFLSLIIEPIKQVSKKIARAIDIWPTYTTECQYRGLWLAQSFSHFHCFRLAACEKLTNV